MLRDKFLVQAISVGDKLKQNEVEELWNQYKNDSTKLENIRMKLRIDGLERDTANFGGGRPISLMSSDGNGLGSLGS